MTVRNSRFRGGFTLIELLVALTILAILSYLSYRGISSLLVAERRLSESTRRIQTIDRFLSEFERSVLFVPPRPVRVTAAITEPAMFAAPFGTRGDYRFSISVFAPAPDLPPQRISYVFAMPVIRLDATANMDFSPPPAEPDVVVLDKLQSASLRFLDTDGRWATTWPPQGRAETLPNAVEITLVFDDVGTVSRLIARP